jgi:hypothetical protein
MAMTRTVLLAGAAALALITARPAYAQLAVEDALNNLWQGLNNSELVSQVAQATKTVAQLQQMYATQQQQLRSITGLTNVTGLIPSLSSGGLTQPLPQVSQIMGLVNGTGLNGNALSGLANGFLRQNTYYAPAAPAGGSTDFNSTWLASRANSTAGLQAAVTQLLQSGQTRMAALAGLRSEIDQQPDIQHMQAINARIAIEQNYATGQAAQTQQIMALAQLQQRAEQQQAEQHDRESADQLVNSTQALP